MERNITLDYTKLFLSFLVVIIHCPVFWEFRMFSNLLVNGLCRIAVPCFFILNGIYLGKVLSNNASFTSYTKRLFIFYLVWMLIYAPFYLFTFKENMSISILLNLGNLIFGFWHLWYIIALIGGVSCLYYLKKNKVSDKFILNLSIVLFLCGWLIQKIELFYPNEIGLIGYIIRSSFPTRNFIFMGFPFISIGYLISKSDFKTNLKKQMSSKFSLLMFFLIIVIETTLQFYMIGRRGFDFYLGLILVCPSLVLYVLSFSKTKFVKDDFISKLSASIYFIHPLVLYMIKSSFPDFNGTSQYLIIVFFSILFSSGLIYANKSLKIFF